jgi:hypothetical protein
MQDFGVDESTLEYEPAFPSESPFAGVPEALEGFEGFGEVPSPFAESTSAVPGGRYVLTHHPVLRHHRGTPPDLILRWNAMPAGTTTVDVVVHLHGYSGRGIRLRLQDKEPISGLDFADPADPSRTGRTRPTLALLPRGNFFGGRYGNGYNFPELVKPGALTRLVADGLALFAQQTGVTPVLGRLVLTGHSGGGAPVTAILRHTDPDEVHVFDGLYSDATAMIAWATKRIAAGSVGSALRVLYRPGSGTQAESKRVQREIVKMLADSSSGRAMAPYFRVEATRTEHNDIPRVYGWQLLADAAADLPGATPGATPRQEAAQEWEGLDPAGEGYDEAGEGFDPESEGFDPEGESFDPEGESFDPESEAFDVESFEPESSGWTDLESESRRRALSTSALRRAWAAYHCAGERMVPLKLLSHRTPVNPLTVDAFTALGAALLATGYQARSTWVYNCRSIRQVDPTRQPQASLHAYGLAVDIDPKWNPHRRHVTEPIRYSPATTLEQRIADVAASRAGTVFTPAQVAAVEAIRTVDGLQVFTWGGRWRDSHDAMHFQIAVTPAELARGLAPAGSPPPGEAAGEMETCEAWENESPAEAEYEYEYLDAGEQGGENEGWRDLELPEATEARWGLYEELDSAWSRTELE